MCLITALYPLSDMDTELDHKLLKNAHYWNEDGSGFSFVDFNHGDPKVEIHKNYKTFHQFSEALKRARELNPKSFFTVHQRNASMGDVTSKANCHPFYIFKGKVSMCHNGTMYKVPASKDKGESDSLLFAKMLHQLPENFLKIQAYRTLIDSFIGASRLAFLTVENKVQLFGSGWIKENNGSIMFSNDYYKKEIPKETNKCTVCGKKLTYYYDKVRGTCDSCNKKMLEKIVPFNTDIKCSVCGIELMYPKEIERGTCYDCAWNYRQRNYRVDDYETV